MNTTTTVERKINIPQTQTGATAAVTRRQNRSLTQWLFNPYSVCDTTNWSVDTGVGKLNIGGLTRVSNITERRTPNRSKHNAYTSTSEFDGNYIEVERLAYNIASEIENNFPRRVARIKALEGIGSEEVASNIVTALLGASMQISEIEGAAEIVPVLPSMLEALRLNMRAISRGNSAQKELLLKVGREFEAAITANIKEALNDLKAPQQEVASGKRTGFDYNAKRNFLALGKPVPDTLKFTDANSSAQNNDQLAKAIDRLATLLGDAPKTETPETEFPTDFISEKEAEEILAATETEEEAKETPQEAETIIKCSAEKARGGECLNAAVSGSEFCRFHAPKSE